MRDVPAIQLAVGVSLVVIACAISLVSDFRSRTIPDRCHVIGLIGALILNAQSLTWAHAALALALPIFLMFLNNFSAVASGLGGGDIKLLSWLSLVVGIEVLYLILISSALGWIYLASRKFRIREFPFAWCIWGGFWSVFTMEVFGL